MHVDGQFIYNTTAQELNAAIAGLGLAYVPGMAKPYLTKGRLKQVLGGETGAFLIWAILLWLCKPPPVSSGALALLVDALSYHN